MRLLSHRPGTLQAPRRHLIQRQRRACCRVTLPAEAAQEGYNEVVSFRTVPHLTAIRCATRQDRGPTFLLLTTVTPLDTFADRSTNLEAPHVSSRPSFQKRQKEQARKEKQRLKAERKEQRKLQRDTPEITDTQEVAHAILAEEQDP